MTEFQPPEKVGKYTPCLNDEGYFTQTPKEYCNVHHVFFGNGLRKLSEKWAMKVYLKPEWHQFTNYSAHVNKETDLELKRYAQQKFEERYSHEFFMEIFKRNYL